MKSLYELKDHECVANISLIKNAEQVRLIWSELELAAQPNFFQSWVWISAWLDLILPITNVYFFCYSIANQPKAMCFITLCRVTRKKGMVRVIQLQLNEYLYSSFNMVNGYNGILVTEEFRQRAWESLLSCLSAFNDRWDECLFSSLTKEDSICCRSALVNGNGELKYSLELDKRCYKWEKSIPSSEMSEDEFVETFKLKSRQQIRQTLSAFSVLGAANVYAPSSTEGALALFDAMEEVHTKRWQAAGKGGSYANPIWVNFHRQLIKNNYNSDLIQILQISVGELTVGYLYGHVYENKVYMHQTGFPQLADNKLRAGYFSHFLAMRYNQKIGIKKYDFLPDFADSYKKFFVDPGEEIDSIFFKRPRWIYRWEAVLAGLKNWRKLLSSTDGKNVN